MGIFKKISDKLGNMGGNTLYYPGCLTKFVLPEIEDSYKNILKAMKIDFIYIPEFNCCGTPVINAGYEEDFKELIEKNMELFKKYGIKRIITNCPGCYAAFKKEYGFPVQHMTQVIAENIHVFKRIGMKEDGTKEQITFHDPCHLGRVTGEYDAPRKVLEGLGFEIIEFENNRENADCCGAGAGLRNNNPELAKKIAKRRMLMAPTEKITTCCTMCYMHMKENAKSGQEVLEMSELLIPREKDE